MTINNLRQMDAEEILKLVKTKICPKDIVRVGVVSDDFLDLAKTYYVDMDECGNYRQKRFLTSRIFRQSRSRKRLSKT